MWSIGSSLANAQRSISDGIGGIRAAQPNTVSGMTVWYKADSLALSDGASVATWSDSGSGGIDLTQATAGNRPVYRATGGPNSKPALQFTGTTPTSLTRTSVLGSSLFGANSFHAFIVQYQSSANSQNMTFYWPGASSLVEAYLAFGSTLYLDYGNSTANSGRISVAQPTGWANAWHITQLIRESPNTGTARIRVDGSELVNGTLTATLTTSNSATFSVGTGASSLTGYIAEIIFYNAALSTSDRQSIEAYLNQKYAIF